MAKLLYLVHRLPYPPNKGDKVRSYHLLKHLAARHEVYLATFVDDPEDEAYIPVVRQLCTELHVARLHPGSAKLASLRGLLSGEALTLPYYRDAGLGAWVQDLTRRQALDAVVVFSSSMAQYAPHALPMLVDFVDVDSAKWTDYAQAHAWPMSWLYRREGRRLLDFEARVAARAACSFFVTDREVALFRQLTPGSESRIEALCNGVDAEFFSPSDERASPYAAGELPLVFTGAMDYWPNADAVGWFAAEVLPALRLRWPALKFYIVGRSPTPAVQALASEAVVVTGTVADVRPYLQHAAAVVAPLRLARGIQNKILEAMAMARPVVAAQTCVAAITAEAGSELLAAEDAADYVRQVDALLSEPDRAERVGRAGRDCVIKRYSWSAHLSGIDHHLARSCAAPRLALQAEAA
ncbi:TIGR03087 family PEP-CTERM/XrtA system glycosyltransferase [Paucibacter sp. XJ19-41]|uniref:TIGR03087 family PEP-CTERM/XrtA system glycosyltransferase n=1 Tax=Paucibacter sp. XJ19-41 TaxID=2927824 RepID=UPI002349313E|nr:TIGR03087 family PEP-CTERM/XrtA system glycosyltransferase [Paucibacter sp. XJ19-41]MDC6166093.1 TIGR03087 family PEP-CTERM/XrtA system glycosyltransferase [Paucibacter sp. XJ19-41]